MQPGNSTPFLQQSPLALNLSQTTPVWNYLRPILILSYSHIDALVFQYLQITSKIVNVKVKCSLSTP